MRKAVAVMLVFLTKEVSYIVLVKVNHNGAVKSSEKALCDKRGIHPRGADGASPYIE